MIVDVTGQPVTLLELRNAGNDECIERLGQPERRKWELKGVGRVREMRWFFPNGDEVRSGEAPGGFSVTSGWFTSLWPFTLDAALLVAGLGNDFPFAPTCDPEGEVLWPDWPGVGQVRILYPIHAIYIATAGPGGGGRRELFDVFTRRAA